MKENNKRNEDGLPRPRSSPTSPYTIAEKNPRQQEQNTSGVNNPYALWSFEQLYSECKKRGLL